MSGMMEPVLFDYGSFIGYLDCLDTIITEGPVPGAKDGCNIVEAWPGVDLSVMSFPVHGPFGEDPMWFNMSSEYDDEEYATPRLASADPDAYSVHNSEDIRLLEGIERSTLISGIALGFCVVLAVSFIAFILYRRSRRRAMDRGRPRPLSLPRVVPPAPSSTAVKGKDTTHPQTPIPATGDINPENARVWDALVALRNEIREIREGDTTETLPPYELQDQQPHS